MRILFDTNIILDVLLNRAPLVAASSLVWNRVEKGPEEGLISAHAVTTIFYIIQRQQGPATAKEIVAWLLQVFGVSSVDRSVLQAALLLPNSDFEDAVTISAAQRSSCDFIVTRDPKGFRGSPVPAFSPEALLPIIRSVH